MRENKSIINDGDFFVSPKFIEKTGLTMYLLMNRFSTSVDRLMIPTVADGSIPFIDIGDHDISFVVGTSRRDMRRLMRVVRQIQNEFGFELKVGMSQLILA